MQIINGTTPSADGYKMPAEYAPHLGTVLIWPVRPGSWTNSGLEAQMTFTEIAKAISESEKCFLLAGDAQFEEVSQKFADNKNVQVININTDDAWARDIGPTCVVGENGDVRGIDWSFNAWGGDYDGLYAHYEKDDAAASAICNSLSLDYYNAKHFVLEGGSIHSDGEGTILVTETCLLSPGRNPNLSKSQIEDELKAYLGAEKIIWLPRGIDGDETNEHVDNVCAFVGPAEVVLAWTDDQNDKQWIPSNESLKVLESETDAKGRKFIIHKLPIPKNPVCISEEELNAMEFEDGEDTREVGERLAASYVNFYITNGGILLPQFGDEHDKIAVKMMESLFPTRKIYPIPARAIIVGGGNIHCITQQIPLGNINL